MQPRAAGQKKYLITHIFRSANFPLSFKERVGVRMGYYAVKERPILILSFPLKGKGRLAEHHG
jgi:hypothetical protein